MHLFKDLRKVVSKQISFQGIQFKRRQWFGSSSMRQLFNQKLEQKKYYSILGFSDDIQGHYLTDSDIKRNYLGMVKKYHSDNTVDESQKLDYEEITKCIILAYEKITEQRVLYQIKMGKYEQIYRDEDYVARKLFGKGFNEIKYEIFKDENSQKRKLFMYELEKVRKDSKYYEHIKKGTHRPGEYYKKHSKSNMSSEAQKSVNQIQRNLSKKPLYLFSGLGVIAVYFFFRFTYENKQEKEVRKQTRHSMGEEKIKEIEKRSTELYEKKLNDLVNSFVEEMPPCLKYPSQSDPDQMQQLLEYTIGPDINLYEVSSRILGVQQNLQKLKALKNLQEAKKQFGNEFNPYPMTQIKVNSAISLSLEAERCLQNIYIKVKDVADQIEQTGNYKPPTVFFRFYGYVMFDIREKPLSLQNYRDTEYISLFDLFFDYYSPIPIKRHQFNEYVVGYSDEDLKMYGQVHLNHRKVPERYIRKQDKIVVMRDEVSGLEQKYHEIWHNFYRSYMRVWKRGYSDRISSLYANN